MNQLSTERRAAIVRALVEGNSARAAARLTGTSRATVLKLLAELGEMCRVYQDHKLRNLKCQRIQCDEIWSFCGAKARAISAGAEGYGDVWTWTALDPDSKLMVSWLVGRRGHTAARRFMVDLAGRLANRIQLTTDGFRAYEDAVDLAFGSNVDFAMLVKSYATPPRERETRYSPAVCIGAAKVIQWGNPDIDHISTSMVERSNLTMRMGMRRFTRLTNAFSRKVENHAYSVNIHFMHYNFCRPHSTLTKAHPFRYPQTPAMAAGIADHVWTLEEVCALLDPRREGWEFVKQGVHVMLSRLRLILERGVEHPSELPACIKQFLVTYDSIPDDTLTSGDPAWQALERLAYELRYYAPGEDSEDTLLDDQQALEEIREALAAIPRM